ncbi:MAG TPA: hypothetical protein PLV51_08485 [Lentimicrobium sp.]|jgi:hypothetical protein|nr:hypothetical protein [Lentimicrobium sp.]
MKAVGSKSENLAFKAVIILHLMLLPVLTSFAQEITAVFTETDDFLILEGDVNKTVFSIQPDNSQSLQMIAERASAMPETLTLSLGLTPSGANRITLTYNHPTDTVYVKKMLLFLGVTQVNVRGILCNTGDFQP